MKLATALTALAAACAASSGRAPGPVTAPACLAAPSSDTTVYDTSQVTRRPERVGGPAPTYPMGPREEGIQGRVLIALIIEATGEVNQSSVSVVRSPDRRLTESALAVVRASQFKPGCLGDQAVRVRVELPIDYSLGGRPSTSRPPGWPRN